MKYSFLKLIALTLLIAVLDGCATSAGPGELRDSSERQKLQDALEMQSRLIEKLEAKIAILEKELKGRNND